MWRKPGRTGAILYAVLAAVVGSATAFFSRLEIELVVKVVERAREKFTFGYLPELIETLFREVHSLKGAARSVNLPLRSLWNRKH